MLAHYRRNEGRYTGALKELDEEDEVQEDGRGDKRGRGTERGARQAGARIVFLRKKRRTNGWERGTTT